MRPTGLDQDLGFPSQYQLCFLYLDYPSAYHTESSCPWHCQSPDTLSAGIIQHLKSLSKTEGQRDSHSSSASESEQWITTAVESFPSLSGTTGLLPMHKVRHPVGSNWLMFPDAFMWLMAKMMNESLELRRPWRMLYLDYSNRFIRKVKGEGGGKS